MKAVPKIPTRRPLTQRLFDYMESSWVPAVAIYVAVTVAVLLANFPE